MPLRVSGKNLDIGDVLRGQVQDRVAAAIGKYFEGTYHGHVVVEKEGSGFRTHCAIHLSTGVTLQASATAQNAYASSDMSAERIEKRLRRYKRRLKGKQSTQDETTVDAPYMVFAAPDADEEAEGGFAPVIVAEETTQLRRLAVSDAVLELDLTGAPVIVFRHAAHGRVNIVYRRVDGHVGWIDPPAAPAASAA